MSTAVKSKMCWSCEGNVPLSAETCPFCGCTLDNPTPRADYKPPYRLAKHEETEAIPVAPMLKTEEFPDTDEDSHAHETKKVMISLACLSVGIIFLIFGSVLGIFTGDDGMLTLRWDGHYWYLYLALGVPLVIIGWRTLGSIVDLEE